MLSVDPRTMMVDSWDVSALSAEEENDSRRLALCLVCNSLGTV
jgi:hypothetical protein